jgi:8-oxo-dGTP diphosphatase
MMVGRTIGMSNVSPVDYTETLPGKRMAAGALFFNPAGEVLIVKPTYREDWLIPGGVVERDESPRQACQREIREELGLECPVQRLLCLEYKLPYGRMTESVQFIFYGGSLAEREIQAITLQADELTTYRFCPPAEAFALLNPHLAGRLKFALLALEQERIIYLEDQVELR